MSSLEKVAYIFFGTLCAVAAYFCYSEHERVPTRALVRGETRPLEATMGVLLRSRVDSTRYLIFYPALTDSVLAGATLSSRRGLPLRDVRVTGDTGKVEWRTGSRSSRWAKGLRVHVTARVEVPATTIATSDTFDLILPGLATTAAMRNKTPMMLGSYYASRTVGDSERVAQYTIYESAAAVAHAATLWLRASIALLALLCIVLAFAGRRLLAEYRRTMAQLDDD